VLEHPVLPFLVAAALVPVVGRRVSSWLLLIAPAVSMAMLLAMGRGEPATWSYYGFELVPVRLDDLSAPFAYVFVGAAFLAGLYGMATFGTRERIAALVSAGGGLAVVLAGDLLTLFVAWEIKAVAAALLIAAATPAREASAMRYLLAHVVGGSLLLAGTVWHLAGGGALAFDSFDRTGAAGLVLLAFLLSAGMPPLHAWLPDSYPVASVAGTVVLATYTTKAALYALLRGFSGFEPLLVVGVVMALYGVLFAILEDDIRRLLSYHIVSQVGFMVAGVGVGTAGAVNGSTAHAFAHILYKGLLLMGAGAVVLATGRSRLSELGGLGRRMPLVFVCTAIGAVSISGLPLFSGFVSKELVVDAAGSDGYWWVVQGLKVASVGTFLSVGLKLLWFTFAGTDRDLRPARIPRSAQSAMVVAAAANVAIGLRPSLLYDLMPSPVDYQPFAAGKLVATLQILGLSALVFALFVDRLRPTRGYSLDTDWVYRGAPLLVAARMRARRPELGWGETPRAAGRRLGAGWSGVTDRVGGIGATGATPSTAALGAVLLVAFLAVLAGSVLS
jgi:multicomponent Na+:H+ antiporter subunit D